VNSFDGPVLDESELTLPQMLRKAGYRTACIGKWHLGWDWEAIRIGERRPEKEGARPED
jgi:arylsulfatase A